MEKPGLFKRGRNLAKAVAKAGAAAISGDTVFCRKLDAEQRVLICEACELFDGSDRTCSDCGCFVDAKAKIQTESCPMAKWPGDIAL